MASRACTGSQGARVLHCAVLSVLAIWWVTPSKSTAQVTIPAANMPIGVCVNAPIRMSAFTPCNLFLRTQAASARLLWQPLAWRS